MNYADVLNNARQCIGGPGNNGDIGQKPDDSNGMGNAPGHGGNMGTPPEKS